MSHVEGAGHRLVGGTAASQQGRSSTPISSLVALGAHLGDPLPDLRLGGGGGPIPPPTQQFPTVAAALRERICTLRCELHAAGLDHGPVSIAARLQQEGLQAPAFSTIRRILTAAGLITPEPKKRPKSSYRRFQADQPNECWQSDFTHWQLADGTGVEIINWLDDHSRYLLTSRAYRRITGQTVISTFLNIVERYGLPQSTLTDNGSVYTSRFTGGRNGFEYLLASLGITQKNGHPGHPQTQGKIERFHQTLKRWLAAQPAAATVAELQTQLDTFTHIYNQTRTLKRHGFHAVPF
jgi:transposase InsO family protein